MDYRQPNLATIKNCYPLLRNDTCLDALGGARWFRTIDLRSGYHWMSMDPQDADTTTFIMWNGTYCFQAMLFWLCNATTTFQRLMNVVLSGLNQDILLVYLDDIIIHSVDLESHLKTMESFL